MATTEERSTIERASAFSQLVDNMGSGGLGDLPIYKGSIVGLNGSQQLVPATSGTSIVLGRAEHSVPALADRVEGASSSVRVRCGVFLLDNDGTNPVAAGDRVCGLLDDETVDDGTVGTGISLRVMEVTANGVYVAIDPLSADII